MYNRFRIQGFIIGILFMVIFYQSASAQHIELFPLAGHPVIITAIHPDDKNAAFFSELLQFKLILLEPGIEKNVDYSSKEKDDWYQARVFLIKGSSKKFKRRQIIKIKIGKFR